MRARVVGPVVTALLVAGLAGCAPAIDLDEDAAAQLQEAVAEVVTAAEQGRLESARSAAEHVRVALDHAADDGALSVARYRQIDDALRRTEAELDAALQLAAEAAAAQEAAADEAAAAQIAAEQAAAEQAAAEQAAAEQAAARQVTDGPSASSPPGPRGPGRDGPGPGPGHGEGGPGKHGPGPRHGDDGHDRPGPGKRG